MDTYENINNTPARDMDSKAEPASPSPRFKVVPKVKPLPSQIAAAKKKAEEERAASEGAAVLPNGKLIRAENEDDDGYDPYSDFHDSPQREPLFQQDPWA